MELFTLSSIKGNKGLQAVSSTDFDDDTGDGKESGSEDNNMGHASDISSSDLDSDQEHERYDKHIEECLDQLYERFLSKNEGKAKKRRRAKTSISNAEDELWKSGEDNVVEPDSDSDKEGGDNRNPLVVPLEEDPNPTQEQIVEQWFSQDVFTEALEENFAANDSEDETDDKIVQKPSVTAMNQQPAPSNHVGTKVSQEEDFQIVPAEPSDSSSDDSTSDESEEYDSDSKAEILAYAKKMLRKKQREQILDDAYNRYVFDDEGLPSWFVEEEKRHNQPMNPVTKEEVAAMKARFREIDARPSKKVAEAKARKKRVAMKKLEKARRKASTISDQTDISERSKGKMIDKLYRSAVPKKPEKKYVVAKKGVQVKPGKGTVVVDRRMKKDKRSHGMGRHGKGKAKGAKRKPARGPKGKAPLRGSAGKGKKGNKRQKMSMND